MENKKYTIELTAVGKGKTVLHRTNEGFNAFELMGLLSFLQSELTEQFREDLNAKRVLKEQID